MTFRNAPASRGGRKTLVALLVLSLLLLGISLKINLSAAGVLSAQTELNHSCGGGEDEFPQFMETHSYGSGSAKVVRMAFHGPISHRMESGLFHSTDPVEDLLRQIRAARQDSSVRAILLEVDSPGGEVTAADEIYHELTLFKESEEDRCIVVLVHDMAASGGYYISLPADRIIAQPTAIIGSIGVIMQTLNIQGLSEKIGVTDTTIKSGANKDLLNPFHPVEPQQMKLMQGMIDTVYDRFASLVAEERSLDKAELKTLADGRLFSAADALRHRLIDGIGYWEDAVQITSELLKEEEVFVVSYSRNKTFVESLFSSSRPIGALQALWQGMEAPRRLYLWRP
ncbi:MAG: signal peptide peptidase SppA [Verrucomicrobiota bacterium]|jgi:protease-4|nr:signal peptide peptidase SppA [Verrucomicrobiota bacterium]